MVFQKIKKIEFPPQGRDPAIMIQRDHGNSVARVLIFRFNSYPAEGRED